MLKKLKTILLKIVDLTALGFLEPYVRLCYGEEPKKQLKLIAQFSAVPIAALLLFLAIWGFLAPKHKTKSGSVPTPTQTWSAWTSIMNQHEQENTKFEAYNLTGEARLEVVAAAEARQAELVPLVAEANKGVDDAREAEAAEKAERIAPLQAKLDEMKEAADAEEETRLSEIEARAEALDTSDAEARDQLKADYLDFDAWEEEQKDAQSDLKGAIKLIQDEKTPEVTAALLLQKQRNDEKQFIDKLIEVAGEDSRELSLAETEAKLAELEVAYAGASGADTFKTLKKIVREQNKLAKTEDRIYAKPWTLPMQIFRSILCVFAGFLVGVAIAVPIGVCCGLSRTFMAAMTPFIALFKPVSPIVWLLIFMIVVGGFFPDPDKSVVLASLTSFTNWITGWIPFVGDMVTDFDINIAFIASALTVSMCSLWATMVNTALGVASVDKDHINVAKVLRLGFFSRLFKIVLPSALPLVFAGMRISLGVGWMVLIAAELLASSEGLGKFTWDQFNNGATDSFAKIVCMVFVVGIIGLILDRIMIIFQRLVSFEGSVATI
ncbi:MAG: ABC transporter permease subunit [Planctomycetota bacterium]